MARFRVSLGPGPVNGNRSSRRFGRISGFPAATYSETSFPMSKKEEDALLHAYDNVPGLDPRVARQLGLKALADSPHYRASDRAPRYGGSSPSSSFITGVDVNPALGLVSLTMKNGKTYSYPLSGEEAAKLVNADSIGRWYNARIKLKRGGPGSATVSRALSDAAVTGAAVAQNPIPPGAISQAGKNLAAGKVDSKAGKIVARDLKMGRNPLAQLSGITRSAGFGGKALGGVGALIVAQILTEAMKAAESDKSGPKL